MCNTISLLLQQLNFKLSELPHSVGIIKFSLFSGMYNQVAKTEAEG